MPRLHSDAKLTKMYELFTKNDDGKLATAEVEALAGFYKGLRSDAKAKVKAPLVAIFNDSRYTVGTKNKFKAALLSAGLKESDLNTSVTPKLSEAEKTALRSDIIRLSDNGGEEGLSKDISFNQVPWELQSSMNDAILSFKTRSLAAHPDAEFPEVMVKVVSTAAPNSKLVGYMLEQKLYSGDHDLGSRLYFNKNGAFAGETYSGH